jgi:hypothetical protein
MRRNLFANLSDLTHGNRLSFDSSNTLARLRKGGTECALRPYRSTAELGKQGAVGVRTKQRECKGLPHGGV